jgi:hypothetical protein
MLNGVIAIIHGVDGKILEKQPTINPKTIYICIAPHFFLTAIGFLEDKLLPT